MNYWLDLFTVKTLEEFQKAGGKFRLSERRFRIMPSSIQPGDKLLCYVDRDRSLGRRFAGGSSCVSGGYSKMHERRGIIPSLEPGFGGWFLTN